MMIFSPFNWKSLSARLRPRWAGGASARNEAEIAELFERLRAAEQDLRAASADLENQFLVTGSDLESLSRSGDNFVAKVEKLVSIATGEQSDTLIFADAIQLIEQAATYLAACQRKTEQMLSELRGYSGQIDELLGAESGLQRAMLPLKFVQTLFRSESAPLGAGVQQMFSALTEEMEALHDQVRDIFGSQFKQLTHTKKTIEQVTAQLEQQAGALRDVIKTHRAEIEQSLQNLKKELAANQQRDVRLRNLSKEFARDVGQVVTALQFQDIVNQKVHHVLEALPKIEQTFSGLDAGSEAAQSAEAFQILHQSCSVEAGQLESAQKELADAEISIVNGVQTVLNRVSEMDSHCLSLDEFKKLTTSFDGTVQVLIEMLEEVRELVSGSVANASRAYETLRPIGGMASDLTANIRAMGSRIQLIGLNAQIQAAQATKDTGLSGLEVLSARTSEISGETNRISERAATQLDALAAGLAASVKAFENLRAEGCSQEAHLNEHGRQQETKLHDYRDTALQTLLAIGNSLDQIRAKGTHALDNVNFGEFHQVKMPAMQEVLTAIAAKSEAWLSDNSLSVAQENLIGHFKRNYTMASERHVHERIVPGAAKRTGTEGQVHLPAKPALEAVPAEAASPLGGNVELF